MGARPKEQPHAGEDFEEMLDIGIGAGEAFFAIGISYDALRLQLKRKGRLAALEKLKQWREQDVERVKHAQGRWWG